MKKINILIIFVSICIVMPFSLSTVNGKGLASKRPQKYSVSKNKLSLSNKNLDINRAGKHMSNMALPRANQTISRKLHKDLSSKSSINVNSGFQGETKEQLITFLNSKGCSPESCGQEIGNLPKGKPLSSLMKLVGLPENCEGKLEILQIAAKIGLSAALWGNPVVGVVGSAALSLTFSQIKGNNEQNSGLLNKKKEDRIFSDIYKYSPYDEKNKLPPNNLRESIKKTFEAKTARVDLQRGIVRNSNLQSSLKQMDSRFAFANPRYAVRK